MVESINIDRSDISLIGTSNSNTAISQFFSPNDYNNYDDNDNNNNDDDNHNHNQIVYLDAVLERMYKKISLYHPLELILHIVVVAVVINQRGCA